MKLFLGIALGLMTSASFAQVVEYNVYRDTAELDVVHSAIKLTDARIKLVPKKIEISRGTWCNRENMESCVQTTVLEREEVLQVSVEYKDGNYQSSDDRIPDSDLRPLYFNLPTSALPTEEILALKKVSGALAISWRKYRARQAFASKFLELEVKKVSKDIQVIDYENSRICPRHHESGQIEFGCKDELSYKPGKASVQLVKVNLK
jgi:hypothetical protein